ncbi:MAG: hypothetical protein JWQ81_6505 [Amycolatopsis sp.]|jgi:hypothetical protein|uniref:hypothetical protein n=1 Tax=Amycolatopsis sp. TaxID=37632 RepID=UPI002630490A|nr:hypothetical protein [Amycolatopsis sp.]MCU1685766.1 hypothetical protein [Amycolatopsis sp.]
MGFFTKTVKTTKAVARGFDRTAEMASRGVGRRVVAASSCPPNQCGGCGRKVRSGAGHCSRVACTKKIAARW